MKPIKVFISSVQKEFSSERRRLCDYIRQDALLGKFFDPFLFEELPAIDLSAQTAYLSEVTQCDLYLALLGVQYGAQEGLSATESEFDQATAQHKYRVCFLKSLSNNETRAPKEAAFIKKVERTVVRKSFSVYEELRSAVYASLVRYLEQKELLRLLPFDASYHPHATFADIDPEKLTTFIRKAKLKRNSKLNEAMSVEQVLTHLDLLDSSDRVTNAAILLFGKSPQRYFPASEVKCIQFYGNEIVKPVPVYQIYRGDLFELIEQALSFVLSRIDIKVGRREVGSDAPTQYELPTTAVSEAIVNAIAHRDYTSNGSVQVMLFRDRLEIWNPGVLPLGLSIEKLYHPHNSIPVNPLVANPLYLSGDIEKAGTGISDMIDKCVSVGLKSPQFVQDENFRTIIWRTEQPDDRATDRVDDRVDDRALLLNDKQMAALAFCRQPQSSRAVLEHLSVKYHPEAINTYIKQLVEAGLLQMTFPDSPNHPKQSYSLTDKGQKLLP